jgi:hypothetical protein
MKTVELAVAREGCWRNIAITLIEGWRSGLGPRFLVSECNRLIATVVASEYPATRPRIPTALPSRS